MEVVLSPIQIEKDSIVGVTGDPVDGRWKIALINIPVVESAGFKAQSDWAEEKWQKEEEGDWDWNWVYSDIINMHRNIGLRLGFIEKTVRCILVEVHIRENSEQKDKGTILVSKCSYFL